MKKDANWKFRSFSLFRYGMSTLGRQGKMDIENVSAFRRRILSTSVRKLPGNSVAEFAVTGVAFLWHQVWLLRSGTGDLGWKGARKVESLNVLGAGRMK